MGSSSESVPLKSKATARTGRAGIGRFSLPPSSPATVMLRPDAARDRPGHDRDDLPRRRRRPADRRAAATARFRSTSRGRAGSSTTRARSGRAVLGAAGTHSPRPTSRPSELERDRDHEPARDDARLGASHRRAGRNAIVWQDRRTAARCAELPYDLFASARGSCPTRTSRRRSSSGSSSGRPARSSELAFGTVDTWLVWRLTEGADACHRRDQRVADDCSSVWTPVDWDDELLALFGVERELLPQSSPSSGVVGDARTPRASGSDRGDRGRPAGRPLRAGLRRRPAREGDVRDGLLRAREHGRRPVTRLRRAPANGGRRPSRDAAQFAVEGSVLVAGAAIQWLRDGLGLISACGETEALAGASTRPTA